MYSGENRLPVSVHQEGHNASGSQHTEATPEPGPALEVIELANGETIW